jgi:uncharacterized phage-associated protein
MYNAIDIARKVLAKTDIDQGDSITNRKLQKLLYYLQGYWLDDIDQSLVEKVTKALRKRRKGEKLRIVFDKQMPDAIRQRLFKQADIDRYDA